MYDSENDDSVKPSCGLAQPPHHALRSNLSVLRGWIQRKTGVSKGVPARSPRKLAIFRSSRNLSMNVIVRPRPITPPPASFQYHHGGQWRSHSRRITSLRFLFPMMDRAPEASGFLLLHDVLAVERVLAMRWSVHLRPSCNMTVPVPVLVLSASLAHPIPESLVKADLARRSPGHVLPISPIRCVILGPTRQVEYLALLPLAVFGLADELLRFEPLRRGLLTILLFTLLHTNHSCSSVANDIRSRLHLV
jgi:hypothetical protein